MDRRIVFFFVFIITVTSTVMVGAVCLLTGQSWLNTALYTLAAMWIMGIVSQLLLHNVYHNIVRVHEEENKQKSLQRQESPINLDDIEEIDQVEEMKMAAHDAALQPSASNKPESVGGHVEQTG